MEATGLIKLLLFRCIVLILNEMKKEFVLVADEKYTKIVDHLYLGTLEAAEDLYFLKDIQVTHMLSFGVWPEQVDHSIKHKIIEL